MAHRKRVSKGAHLKKAKVRKRGGRKARGKTMLKA